MSDTLTQSKTAADFPVGASTTTRRRTITEFDVASFASLTWDSYPVHTDEISAAAGPFGGRIASGPLTLAYAVGLMCVSNWYEDAIIAFVGAEKLRFVAPVRIDDTISVSVKVIENRPTSKGERAAVTVEYTIVNQHGETVLTMQPTFLMKA